MTREERHAIAGSLVERLAALRAEKEAARDPAVNAVLDRSTAELQAAGLAGRALGVGDPAPHFARPDTTGATVRLGPLLSRGPVVLSFFRGRW